MPLSEPLLRTLAAVPPSSRVLELECRPDGHTEALVRLGFDVYACAPGEADVREARAAVCDALGPETDQRITVARPGALGYPDDFFDWIVAYRALDQVPEGRERKEALEEARRVLKPGGWIWVALDVASFGAEAEDIDAPGALSDLFLSAGFALAEAPVRYTEASRPLVRGIYRKVDADTVR